MRRLRVLIADSALTVANHHSRHVHRHLSRPPLLAGISQCCFFSGKSLRRYDLENRSGWRIRTLAIETSCDDTSVAILQISRAEDRQRLKSEVLFHDKVTADTTRFGGIHPLVALDSHQIQLGLLVQKAIQCLRPGGYPNGNDVAAHRHPDFVSVTRGPGMRSNLSVGLNLAKGLALAWGVPLVGVHHMQAHALTPRLCSTIDLDNSQKPCGKASVTSALEWTSKDVEPRFPFLSLLVSGGHTMLIDSQSLTEHRILAETQDIAIGDYLDKAARAILPASNLITPFGRALEDYAFPDSRQYDYVPPKSRQEELERRTSNFGWSLAPPLSESKGGEKSSRRMIYSFSGLLSTIQRLMHQPELEKEGTTNNVGNAPSMSTSARQELAREAQRVAFEHLGSRILLYLESVTRTQSSKPTIESIVVSGGVASNKFLRHVLRSMLDARGCSSIKLLFPPLELCTDNALMIAWAGMEMYDAGYNSDMSIEPLRKWSMDSSAEDGGILGVGRWKKSEGLREAG